MLRYRTLCVAALSGLAAACGGTNERLGGTVVSDSAGTTIVRSAAPAWGADEGWSLADTPSLTIGVGEGAPEYTFHRVAGARRHPDGTIVVADEGSHQVRVYGANGRHLRSVGSEGSGPGQFQAMEMLALLPGDTVLVWDFIQGRLTFLPASGAPGRTASLSGTPPLPQGVQPRLWAVGRLRNGEIVARSAPTPGAAGGIGRMRDTVTLVRTGADGRVLNVLARAPGDETFVQREGRGTTGFPFPFGRALQLAVGGDSVFVGSGDAVEFRVYGRNGLRRVVRADHAPVPVAAADAERYRREELEGVTGPGRDRLERYLTQVPFPATLPAHGRLLVDDLGYLWVLHSRPSWDRTVEWTIFAPDGRWLGRLRMPDAFRAMHIGRDFVLGRHVDEEGVESIRLYALDRKKGNR